MEAMEASFKSRVEEIFGPLFGPAGAGVASFWSVRENTLGTSKGGPAGSPEADSSGSDGDGDEHTGARYETFVRLERSRRRGRGRGRHGEGLELGFSGEEDPKALESEEGDEDDVEEGRRQGKRKKREEEGVVERSEGAEETDSDNGDRAVLVAEEDEDPEEEARHMREMVGMDETLDFEEEEDEYDKVAVGREGASGRIFMGQIIDFGPAILNPLNPLPTSLSEMRQAARDARANHRAALARLEEDDQEAAAASGDFNENAEAPVDRGSDMGECTIGSGEAFMLYDLPVRLGIDADAMDIDGGDGSGDEELSLVGKHSKQHLVAGKCLVNDGSRRRKSGKRVRFALDEGAERERKAGRISELESGTTSASENMPATQSELDCQTAYKSRVAAEDRYSRVPDYIKNPSNYIHYTIDWTEEDEEQQNMAAFRTVAGANSKKDPIPERQEEEMSVEPQGTVEVPKVSFIPRIFRGGNGNEEFGKRSSDPLGTAVPGEVDDGGSSAQDPASNLVNIAANFDMDNFQREPNSPDSNQEDSVSPSRDGDTGMKPTRVLRRYRAKGKRCDENETG